MSLIYSIINLHKLTGISKDELGWKPVFYKGNNVLFIYALQEDDSTTCPHCNAKPIKYGKTKESIINHGNMDGTPTYIVLRKQRYKCTHCNKTFLSGTNLTKRNCNISEPKKAAILMDLTKKKTVSLIAKEHNVSFATVQRILKDTSLYTKNNFVYLPKEISLDEFRAFNSKKAAKFAMNIVDCETHKILDICVDRKLGYVKRYFEQYPTKIREEVKIVCMDMYQPYISLTKVMFPNAKIVLDRFHILQNVSRALNAYRIELMKRYDKKDGMYKIFKRYGMLLTKSRGKLEMNKARWIPHLQTLKTEEYLLNQMLSTDEKLRNSYWIYQTIRTAIKLNSMEMIESILKYQVKISMGMEIAIKTIKRYKKYIRNTLETKYNNGAIEAQNNNIKVLKRIAYGYRNFQNLRNRMDRLQLTRQKN